MLQDVLSPSSNSLITSASVFDFAGVGSHALTRPSSLVTARKRTHGCSPETLPLLVGDGVRRVSVATIPEAGVPDTVFKTWHVIGAAIGVGYGLDARVHDVSDEVGLRCSRQIQPPSRLPRSSDRAEGVDAPNAPWAKRTEDSHEQQSLTEGTCAMPSHLKLPDETKPLQACLSVLVV